MMFITRTWQELLSEEYSGRIAFSWCLDMQESWSKGRKADPSELVYWNARQIQGLEIEDADGDGDFRRS